MPTMEPLAMLTHLENEAAQIEATLRASLATETVAASPVAASSPSADTRSEMWYATTSCGVFAPLVNSA